MIQHDWKHTAEQMNQNILKEMEKTPNLNAYYAQTWSYQKNKSKPLRLDQEQWRTMLQHQACKQPNTKERHHCAIPYTTLQAKSKNYYRSLNLNVQGNTTKTIPCIGTSGASGIFSKPVVARAQQIGEQSRGPHHAMPSSSSCHLHPTASP
eukprot:6492139-Amphidinium_carterae.2